MRADTQTDGHTDTLIATLRTPHGGEATKNTKKCLHRRVSLYTCISRYISMCVSVFFVGLEDKLSGLLTLLVM